MTVPVITFFNNKGGVGKTSLVFHLAWMLSELGKRVIAIDLDPQANLTSAFLPEETLERLWEPDGDSELGTTVFQCLRPLARVGSVRKPLTQAITPMLHLVPGDLGLAGFEDSLSEQWAKAMGSTELYRPFLVLTSFWDIAQQAAQSHGADLVLADVGPNLGAINRSALIASDHVFVPLAADLFSLQGLRNLGPTLRSWRTDWRKRVDNWPLPEFALPAGNMRPEGYIVMQHIDRLSRPVRAYKKWMDRIPATYRQSILDELETAGEPSSDPNCLARLKHYRSLIPMAQEVRKPIFHLTSADGAIGSHAAAVREAGKDFRTLALSVLQRCGLSDSALGEPKPSRESMTASIDLTDAEKRDLIALIQAGKPLPERYRFMLFEDKREVELVWNGKTRDVCTTVLPFQTLEHVDEPRPEAATSPQSELFDPRGRQVKGWTNKLIWGDNKLILSSLKSGPLREQIEEAGGLKLIYIDPPFDVGADFSMDIEIGGETFHKEPNILEQIAYRDTWGRGADSFIAMIYERLILMRDLLAEDGAIYVHCDWRVNAFIRLALDDVFGRDAFVNELVWKRRTGYMGTYNRYGAVTDTLLWYGKTDRYQFTQQTVPNDPVYLERFKHRDDQGRLYRVDNLTSPNPRPNLRYAYKGHQPPDNGWAVSLERMEEMDREGRLDFPKKEGGRIQRRRFVEELEGQPVQNLWDDVFPVNPMAAEGLGFPTQKPESLLERIIKTSSSPDDVVADFFVGSGTTAAVAEKLGRKWIATDLGKFGIHTTRKRLIGVQRQQQKEGKPFRAFEVLNLGRYERQAYLHLGSRLTGTQREAALSQKEREFRELILRAYKAEPLPEGAGSFFHGAHNGRLVVVGPINLPVGRLFVEEVIVECRKRGASRVDLLAFEFEMGLFPAVLDESRGKGIELAPKHIPPEVFDKRAVERGQVVFHDIAFIEATPRYNAKDKASLQIELVDFSVYYTQGAMDSVTASLKEGKSQVVCDAGQLWKVTKSKAGVVSRDKLTGAWTDWVDYWAVDFDFGSRKEIVKRPKGMGLQGSLVTPSQGELVEWEDWWTGGYIFENEWQSFRTRQERGLELKTPPHRYAVAGRYQVAVKVIDIFGNDTMTILPVSVG